MNAFSADYQPQLKWHNHDTTRMSKNGQKGAILPVARLSLPGSLRGVIPMTSIPPRGSINTETVQQRDRTDKIRRGGR
jgi:hypothetical protein